MIQTLTRVDQQPQWVKDSLSENDKHKFRRGFDYVVEMTHFSFSTTELVGAAAVKAFFIKLDGELATVQRTLDSWQCQTHHVLRGEADLKKKDCSGAKIVNPYMRSLNLYKDEPDKFEPVCIVNGPAQTENRV